MTWVDIAWIVGAVIIPVVIIELVYAHIHRNDWVKVCSYCGKEGCKLTHRWVYRRKRHTKR